jgi:hypothetical protein
MSTFILASSFEEATRIAGRLSLHTSAWKWLRDHRSLRAYSEPRVLATSCWSSGFHPNERIDINDALVKTWAIVEQVACG